MADTKIRRYDSEDNEAVDVKHRDLGDDTHAQSVWVEGSSAGSGLSPSTPGAIVDDDVDGTDETLIIDDTGVGCKAVIVCNHGGMYDLLITDVASGASAPTISATTGAVYRIPPGTWATLDIGPNRDVYARSASGDATVLSLSAQVRS